MPFDFKKYDAKCQGLTPEELQREWQHYTRLISGASTSTAVSGLAVPLTMGVSTIGVAVAAPAIHNARKKREIIQRHLDRHNTKHVTRKRDVLGSVAFSGTVGVVTMGLSGMGADVVAAHGAEHGISAIVENELAVKVGVHAAMDGVGLAAEKLHTDHKKKKEAKQAFEKAGVFQAVADAKAAEAGFTIVNPPQNGESSSSIPTMPGYYQYQPQPGQEYQQQYQQYQQFQQQPQQDFQQQYQQFPQQQQAPGVYGQDANYNVAAAGFTNMEQSRDVQQPQQQQPQSAPPQYTNSDPKTVEYQQEALQQQQQYVAPPPAYSTTDASAQWQQPQQTPGVYTQDPNYTATQQQQQQQHHQPTGQTPGVYTQQGNYVQQPGDQQEQQGQGTQYMYAQYTGQTHDSTGQQQQQQQQQPVLAEASTTPIQDTGQSTTAYAPDQTGQALTYQQYNYTGSTATTTTAPSSTATPAPTDASYATPATSVHAYAVTATPVEATNGKAPMSTSTTGIEAPATQREATNTPQPGHLPRQGSLLQQANHAAAAAVTSQAQQQTVQPAGCPPAGSSSLYNMSGLADALPTPAATPATSPGGEQHRWSSMTPAPPQYVPLQGTGFAGLPTPPEHPASAPQPAPSGTSPTGQATPWDQYTSAPAVMQQQQQTGYPPASQPPASAPLQMQTPSYSTPAPQEQYTPAGALQQQSMYTMPPPPTPAPQSQAPPQSAPAMLPQQSSYTPAAQPGSVHAGAAQQPGSAHVGAIQQPGSVHAGTAQQPGSVHIGAIQQPGSVHAGTAQQTYGYAPQVSQTGYPQEQQPQAYTQTPAPQYPYSPPTAADQAQGSQMSQASYTGQPQQPYYSPTAGQQHQAYNPQHYSAAPGQGYSYFPPQQPQDHRMSISGASPVMQQPQYPATGQYGS